MGKRITDPNAIRARRRRQRIDPSILPPLYAGVARGACMEPEIPDGTKLLFSRAEPCRPGDVVVIWLRLESVEPGTHQARVKRLVALPDRTTPLLVEMINPPTLLFVAADNVLAMHRCMGPVPAEMTTCVMSATELAADYRRRTAEHAAA